MVTQKPDGTQSFHFYCPQAEQVTLVGEFNGWNETSLPMARTDDGWWRYELRLAPGCYRFRYRSEDGWYTDYAAFGVEPSALGLNSVLQVLPPLTSEPVGPRGPVVRLPQTRESDDPWFNAPPAERNNAPAKAWRTGRIPHRELQPSGAASPAS